MRTIATVALTAAALLFGEYLGGLEKMRLSDQIVSALIGFLSVVVGRMESKR